MGRTAAEVKDELQKEVFLLRALRNDALCHLHLGGRKAEGEWEQLEPVVQAALEHADREVSEESCASVTRAAMAVRTLCDSLRVMALEGAKPFSFSSK
jgi:hypothetical protein